MTSAIRASIPKENNWLDYVQDYCKDPSRMRDTADLTSHAIGWMNQMPLSDATLSTANTIRDHAKKVSGGLSIPLLASTGIDFFKKGFNDSEVAKRGLELIGRSADAALFLDSAKIVNLKGAALPVEGAMWGAGGLYDVWDLVQQVRDSEIHGANMEKATAPEAKDLHRSKRYLANLTIIKNVTSIALAVIAIISLIFGYMAMGVMIVPIVFLALSTLFVVLNIVTYFYGRMVEDQQKLLENQGKI